MPFDGNEQVHADPVLRVLIGAREIIASGRWCQRAYRDGGYCAIGAIWETAGRTTGMPGPSAVCALERALPTPWRNICSFNDAWWRRRKRVVRLFDDAIKAREAVMVR